MKTKLIFLYGFILAVMIAVNVWASFAGGNVIPAGAVIWNLPWGRATFFDTIFGFLTFWLWTAYQEKNWFRRILWFVLIMGLGNIAIAAYMLIKLYRLKPNSGIRDLLLRQETL
jgi:hypothetical protein